MAEQEKNCYIGINGKKYGPLSEQDIKKLYTLKKVNEDTKFARTGDKEWIPLSQSGILSAAPPISDEVLPPLPANDKCAETNTNSPAKKSKLVYVAAGLGTLVVVVIAVTIGLIATMDTNSAVPTNSDMMQSNSTKKPSDTSIPVKIDSAVPANSDMAQSNSTEKPSDTSIPVKTEEFEPEVDSTEEYLTFREPHFGIEFDYPGKFEYVRTDNDDSNNLIIYNFNNLDHNVDTESFIMVTFQTGQFRRSLEIEFSLDEYSLDLEYNIDVYKDGYESFELLDTFESTNSIMFYYRGLEKNHEVLNYTPIPRFNCVYINHGDYSNNLGISTINMVLTVPLEHEDEYKNIIQTMIGSLRYTDRLWKEAEDLIPAQYKEGELGYNPAYNIEDDNGGILFYGFYFYAKDTYGEIWVNPVTGEIEVDSREMPETTSASDYDNDYSSQETTTAANQRYPSLSAAEREENARILRERAYRDIDKIAYARNPTETFAYTADVAMIYSAAYSYSVSETDYRNAQGYIFNALSAAKTWEMTPGANYNQTMVEQFLNVLDPELKDMVKDQYQDTVIFPTVDDNNWYYTNGRQAPQVSAEEQEKLAKINELRDLAEAEYRKTWDTNEWGNKYRHFSKSAALYFEANALGGANVDFQNGLLRTEMAMIWAYKWQNNSYPYDPFDRASVAAFMSELPSQIKKYLKESYTGDMPTVDDFEWYFDVD